MSDGLRDIGLILFGYALATDASKAHVFGMIDPDELPKEIADLLEAVKSGKKTQLVSDWFADRQVVIEKGIKAIDACGKSIRSHTRRQARHELVSKIAGGHKLMSESEFLAFVEEELGRFKKLLDKK